MVVITSKSCKRAPLVSVSPLENATLNKVARASNGGIAGIALSATGPVTVRAYENGMLVGEVTVDLWASP